MKWAIIDKSSDGDYAILVPIREVERATAMFSPDTGEVTGLVITLAGAAPGVYQQIPRELVKDAAQQMGITAALAPKSKEGPAWP